MNFAPNLPANINAASARLPQTYEKAKAAIAECASIDECMDWADKAKALASYARQADDDELKKMAMRIQARAVRRCGELLKQFDGRGRPAENSSSEPTISQRAMAKAAGLSKDRQVTAVRVANVPVEDYERQEKSETPPTIKALAKQGTVARPAPEQPDGFKEATQIMGYARAYLDKLKGHDPARIANGIYPFEAKEYRKVIAEIDAWHDRIVVNLRG